MYTCFCVCVVFIFAEFIIYCTVGYLLSCAFGDLDLALAVAPVIHIPLLVFGGFYLNSG